MIVQYEQGMFDAIKFASMCNSIANGFGREFGRLLCEIGVLWNEWSITRIMKPIKRNLTYVVDGTGRLRLKIRWNGNEIYITTGFYVVKSRWNGTRCMPRSVHRSGKSKIAAVEVNKSLDEIEDKIDRVFFEAEMSNKMPAIGELRQLFSRRGQQQSGYDFKTLYANFIAEGCTKRDWAANTVKSVKQVLNLVLKFDEDASIEAIDNNWLDRFVEYQKTHKLSDKRFMAGGDGYSNPVIQKNCRVFRWFLKWAGEKGIVPKSLAEFHPHLKTITKPVIFLDWEELMKVWNLKLDEGGWLDKARDLFCFESFTSLRYSDVVCLEKSQVSDDVIRVVTVKTATALEIDLNKYSRAILEKYKDLSGDKALPYMTNHHLNYYIKQVGKMAGIDEIVTISQFYGSDRMRERYPKWQLLSSHAGRRTFICNALALGISPNVVMKWTGHSEYSAMRPYIDIADSIKRESMSKFDKVD